MNSNAAITPTAIVSIHSSLQVFAEADVEAAQDKKRDDNPDKNNVTHIIVGQLLCTSGNVRPPQASG
jgi:hypothetical protein